MVVSRSARCVVAVVVLVAVVAVTPASVARAAPTVKSDAAHQVTLTDLLGWSWALLRDFVGAGGPDRGPGISSDGLTVQPVSLDEGPETSPDGVASSPPTADEGPDIDPNG